jgi:TolA-binding protein
MKLTLVAVLFLLFISCSRRTAETTYTEGNLAESQKNYQHAAELFESVVSEYSSSALAESSLVKLSILYNTELKDPRKTLGAYQRCYAMFPASRQAPTMLFLTGFVYNNDLHLLDSARLVYETFLAKYPKHELASSAQFELQTLGKEPGDILPAPVLQNESKKSHAVASKLK